MSALLFILVWLIAVILIVWVLEKLFALPPFNVSPTAVILIEIIVAVVALLILLGHFGLVNGV